MSIALIMDLIALAVKLEPEAVKLINSLIGLFQDKTPDEQQIVLDKLKSALQPMMIKE